MNFNAEMCVMLGSEVVGYVGGGNSAIGTCANPSLALSRTTDRAVLSRARRERTVTEDPNGGGRDTQSGCSFTRSTAIHQRLNAVPNVSNSGLRPFPAGCNLVQNAHVK